MGSTSSVFAPVTFNGSSKFSSDFQQVLTRAVAIQSLPLQGLESQLANLQAEQATMMSLQTTFNSLQSAIQGIDNSSAAVSASSSNPAAVSATASGALPGTYSVKVTTLGSETTTISSAGAPPVTDPTTGNISPSASYTLTVDGNNTTINPQGNSLDALAQAINSAGANVQATVVNVGTNSSPDYRLSVTSTQLAPDTIQLNDGTNNLLSQLSLGGATAFTVNGTSTTSNSQQVTLAPGLTVNLLQTTASPVTITVAQDSASLSSSLSSFATAYNAAVDALSAQHGQNAGALSGDSTILTLGQALSAVNQYNGGGTGLTSLADMGLNLDATGHFTFDAGTFNNANPATVQQFLGSIASGGFLQAANNTLTSLTDPTSGVIQDSLISLGNSITNENNLISQQQDLINSFQTNMQQELAAADATISVLESQVTQMGNLFATMYPNVNTTSATGSPTVTGG